MRTILFVNGEYSCYTRYKEWIDSSDCIVCADGGANQAHKWKVRVDHLLGDLDSVEPEALAYYREQNTEIQAFSPIKDETDTQLALQFLESLGADEIILLGSMGGRIDHSLSNLFAAIPFVKKGIRILHVDKESHIWLTASSVTITGKAQDIVSVFSLSEKSRGVTLQGFQYPLQKAELSFENPYAVSNLLLDSRGTISVEEGILSIIHFR